MTYNLDLLDKSTAELYRLRQAAFEKVCEASCEYTAIDAEVQRRIINELSRQLPKEEK